MKNFLCILFSCIWLTSTICQTPIIKQFDEFPPIELSPPDSSISHYPDGSNKAKQKWEYDASLRTTLYAKYRWDKNVSQWIGESKKEYQYDNNGNRTLESSYSWNDTTKVWVGQYIIEKQFDNQGNVTSDASYTWDHEKNTWTGTYNKSEYAYDDRNNTTLYIIYRWNKEKNNWIEKSKEETTHNSCNKIVLFIKYININGTWIGNYKHEKIFDTDDKKILTSRSYRGDTITNEWINQSFSSHSYDIDGKPTISSAYRWDENTNEWVNSIQYKYTYDADRNEILCIKSRWNYQTNSWQNDTKFESIYNNGKLIYSAIYFGDKATNEWNNYSKTECNYNNANQLISKTHYEWNKETNEWRKK